MQTFDSIVSLHYEGKKPKTKQTPNKHKPQSKQQTRKSSISSYMKITVNHRHLNIIIFLLQSLKKALPLDRL